MINESERHKLNAAAEEVFGTMYFTPVELLAELPAKDEWHLEKEYIKTDIEFNGVLEARLLFYFPLSLAVNIAAGFLGLDEEMLSENQIVDTMRESANMIVGSFLGRLDPEGLCALGIPGAEKVTGFSPETTEESGDLLALASDFGYIWGFFAAKS